MNQKLLFFIIGIVTVVGTGAASNQFGAPGLGLNETGITFPDGSMQTTAANGSVKEPLTVSGNFSSSLDGATSFYVGSDTMYTVPVGKVLVIETVSMTDYVTAGAGVDLYFWIAPPSLSTRTFKLRVERTLPLFSGTSIDGIFATEALKIRLDAGGTVRCAGKSTSSSFSPGCAFSGYLEDAP